MLAHAEKVKAAMNETSMPTETSFQDDSDWGDAEPTPAPAILVGYKTRRSTAFGKMALSMAKAQGAMRGALKDAANPFFKSKYADLASVWDDCRMPLSANEIAVFQMPTAAGAKVTITTLLAHSSGEWLESDLEMRSKDESPQGIGSVISYARRYALAAMVGVYQIDDDGEGAHGRHGNADAAPEGRPQKPQNYAEAKRLADKFRKALDSENDSEVYDVHVEANKNQDLYLAAGQQLKAAERTAIKAAVERIKVPNTNRAAREPAEA